MSKPATVKELAAVVALPLVLWVLASKIFPAPKQVRR